MFFFNEETPVTITGSTSGVKAKVIGFKAGTSTTQPILYYIYQAAGGDNSTIKFSESENITADTTITHTTAYASGVACATTVSFVLIFIEFYCWVLLELVFVVELSTH